MIKVFDGGKLSGGEHTIQDEVNLFLKKLRNEHKIHVTAKDKYLVIVVEHNN